MRGLEYIEKFSSDCLEEEASGRSNMEGNGQVVGDMKSMVLYFGRSTPKSDSVLGDPNGSMRIG